MKKPKPRRKLRIVTVDGQTKDFEIVRATKVNVKGSRLYLDGLPNGGHSMIWTPDFMEEFSSIDRIEVIREEA